MWSPEARVLVRPAAVFRELVHDNQPGGLASRIVLLAFTLGCFVSSAVAPTLTPRVVLDGATSFALIPLLEVCALAVVFTQGARRRLPFGQAAGWFFIGNAPWILWLIAMAFASNFVPTRYLGLWIAIREPSMILPAAVSLRADLHFFHEANGRSTAGSWFDALFLRAIGWTMFIAYFLGTSIYGRAASLLSGLVSG